MIGTSSRPLMPPTALTSSIARSVPRSWLSSMTDVTPVCENSTPTRQGSLVELLRAMTNTLRDDHRRTADGAESPVPSPPFVSRLSLVLMIRSQRLDAAAFAALLVRSVGGIIGRRRARINSDDGRPLYPMAAGPHLWHNIEGDAGDEDGPPTDLRVGSRTAAARSEEEM